MKKENRKYTIEQGKIEDYPQHYNSPLELKYNGMKTALSAGLSDEIYVYRDGDNFVILTVNNRLGYAGLEYIEAYNGQLSVSGSIFLDNTPAEENMLKKDLLDYSESYIANFLMQWIN
jgi:hypothetical protein